MGTYARLFCDGTGLIPEEKREEFAERIAILYQNGGMMDVEWVSLCGMKVPTIRKAKMNERGMDFYYNYFEDDYWENAGFNKSRCHVWSNKIGWNCFFKVVVAAHVLQELYTEGVAVTMVSGGIVTGWQYVGWINFLFDEHFHVKNFDPWKLFEALHDSDSEYERGQGRIFENFVFGDKRYAFIGKCEIYAVLYSTQEAMEIFNEEATEKLEVITMKAMATAMATLEQLLNDEVIKQEFMLQELMKNIRKYYEGNDEETCRVNADDSFADTLYWCLKVTDAPALITKKISEIYGIDFWELWSQVRDVVKRKNTILYGNDDYYIEPIPTTDFLKCTPDDMIPFWKGNDELEFSIELWQWFEDLRSQFDEMMNTDFSLDRPIHYVIHLMQEAQENYYNIFTFTDFWEETLENLNDKRYQVLWKLYEKMLRDSELRAAGDVIFVPEGKEHENEGLFYLDEQPKRRLIRSWNIMDPDKKNNKARVTLRRYMALVANKALRDRVFGF